MSLDEYNDKLNFLAACTAVNVQQQRSKPWLHFLSCLYGSERARRGLVMHSGFLSCLYGSEPAAGREQQASAFLSCLYGSELAPKTYNHLKEKEIPSFSCQKPSFFEVS